MGLRLNEHLCDWTKTGTITVSKIHSLGKECDKQIHNVLKKTWKKKTNKLQSGTVGRHSSRGEAWHTLDPSTTFNNANKRQTQILERWKLHYQGVSSLFWAIKVLNNAHSIVQTIGVIIACRSESNLCQNNTDFRYFCGMYLFSLESNKVLYTVLYVSVISLVWKSYNVL